MTTAAGTQCFCVLVLAAWIADLLETASLLNVRSFPSDYPDASFLVHKDQLNSVDGDFPRRTEEHHDKARQCPPTATIVRAALVNASTSCRKTWPCVTQVVARVQRLRDQGASKQVVEAELRAGGLRNTFEVGLHPSISLPHQATTPMTPHWHFVRRP